MNHANYFKDHHEVIVFNQPMKINSPCEQEEFETIFIYFNNAEIKTVLHKTENDHYVDPSHLNYWKNDIMNKEDKLEEIAQRVLGVETLDNRGNDRQDSVVVYVWSIKDALIEAYELGKKEE